MEQLFSQHPAQHTEFFQNLLVDAVAAVMPTPKVTAINSLKYQRLK